MDRRRFLNCLGGLAVGGLTPRNLPFAAGGASPFAEDARPSEASKAYGSGHFGEWIEDQFGMPAYRYTCDQISDPKAVTPVFTVWRSPTDHTHQVGNDRIVAAISNYGYVQARQDEGAPKFLNDYSPERSQYGGGFGYSLANAHFYLGDYAQSESLNQRALAMDRQLYGDRHPNVAEDYINLAAIQTERSNFKAAEQLNRQALSILETFYGKTHPETASVMTLTARALVSENQLPEAAAMLKDALAVQEQLYKGPHPRIASTLNELGKIAEKEGNFKEAAVDFHQETEIYTKVYNGKHYYIGIALSNEGGVAADQQQYQKAENLFRQALQMYSETLPANHQLIGIAQIRLGGVLARQHRYSEAEAQSLPGYENLSPRKDAPAQFLQNARQDLIEEYGALKQPEKVARIEAEMAGVAPKPAQSARK